MAVLITNSCVNYDNHINEYLKTVIVSTDEAPKNYITKVIKCL